MPSVNVSACAARLDHCGIANIGGDRDSVQLPSQRVAGDRIDIGQHRPGARTCEQLRDRQPDPTHRPGDQRRAVFEAEGARESEVGKHCLHQLRHAAVVPETQRLAARRRE